MSPGERETIAVRPHYQALVPRLWRTDLRRYDMVSYGLGQQTMLDPTEGPDVTIVSIVRRGIQGRVILLWYLRVSTSLQ
jgi:hypothetical protein